MNITCLKSKLGLAEVKLSAQEEAALMARFDTSGHQQRTASPAYLEDSLLIASAAVIGVLNNLNHSDEGVVAAANELCSKASYLVLRLRG